ncbi:hypothetical protein WOLCODRAFT_140694 [Wolfiporia cocos MD-104 SS10]|uniref:Autophagy-related protein 27 n=1 Tax=Wolfiporia cocos (strain MD-104) TaxID=742152 RepID=A0A2H3JB53_WOLCO|nr:hypothetical protein WOLCODRAFT_140694 [Wolfiporia cocos MD-104 SS10]
MRLAAIAALVPLCRSLAAAAATGQSLTTLAKSCRFTLDNQKFDLCPVFEGNDGGWTVAHSRQTPPTVTKTEYKISFQGPLKRSKKVSDDEQCPEGAWVCMIVTNTRPKNEDEEPRVLQVVPVAGELSLPKPKEGDDFVAEEYQPGINMTAKLVPATQKTKHDILHVHLHGGYYVHKQQKADFQFVCDHKAEEPTNPTTLWNWNGTHTFEWRTKHACGERLSKDPPPPPPPPSDEPEEDPDEPPKDSEDDEVPGKKHKLLDPDQIAERSRQSMMRVLASSAAFMLVIMYLVYFPPRRLRRYITSYVKTHPRLLRSRVGERVLVRWSHEDFPVFDASEEDTMVNTNAEYEGIGTDEQIPLKPSPRRSVLANYGSAT